MKHIREFAWRAFQHVQDIHAATHFALASIAEAFEAELRD
jgi:hypothetical protein